MPQVDTITYLYIIKKANNCQKYWFNILNNDSGTVMVDSNTIYWKGLENVMQLYISRIHTLIMFKYEITNSSQNWKEKKRI